MQVDLNTIAIVGSAVVNLLALGSVVAKASAKLATLEALVNGVNGRLDAQSARIARVEVDKVDKEMCAEVRSQHQGIPKGGTR